MILRSRRPNPGDTTTEAESINKNVCLSMSISAPILEKKPLTNQKVELRKQEGEKNK